MQHEAGEGHEVQTADGLGQPFIVAHQAAEARLPGEAALHDPAPGQQHEAPARLGVCDDLQAEALRLGVGRRLRPGIALIDVGQLPVAPVTAWTVAASASTCARSCAVAGVTWSASRWPRVSTAAWIFDPFFRLAPS